MADFDFKIVGIDEALKALSQLPNDLNDRIQQDIAKKGAQLVAKELRDKAPEGNNDKKSKNKIGSNVIVKATANGAIVGFKKKVWYVKLLELGTKVRTIVGKGKYKSGNRGSISRRPFIGTAHDTAAPKVVEYLSTNYLTILNKALKKYLKRLG